MNDIQDREDVKTFVNKFYACVQEDELLAPIFALRIKREVWQQHLKRMYDFWNTVLFYERSYKGNPFAKHLGLPLENKHFIRWTSLFKQVINDNFKGDKAEEVKDRIDKMASMFEMKIQRMKDHPNYKLIM